MGTKSNLEQKLKTLNRFFNTRKLSQSVFNPEDIAHYYRTNRLPLSFIGHNFVHLALENDLFGQAKIIESHLPTEGKILELGSGRGGNTRFLADRHLSLEFWGVDLPKGQLDFAQKTANFHPIEGDYHHLDFPTNQFDLAFAVETICHSSHREQVYSEVFRVLKPGAQFILIDFVLKKRSLSSEEKLAHQLTAHGMATHDFDHYQTIEKQLARAGLKLLHIQDLSPKILPSLERVNRKAAKFFRLPPQIINFLLGVLPQNFTANILTGYLFQELVQEKVCGYYFFIAQKA